jgi:hypothetical protein
VPGQVDLILTAVRADHTAPRRGRQPTGPHPDPDPAGASPAVGRLAGLLARCRPLLRPGGHVVVAARPLRRAGRLVDLPNLLGRAAGQAGLVPVDRCAALTSPLPHRRPPAAWRSAGTHLTVYVFQAPPDAEQAGTIALPPTLPRPAPLLPAAGHLDAVWGWAA